ncbi:hypothetical protein ACLOJK_034529 [Asimina triloba]
MHEEMLGGEQARMVNLGMDRVVEKVQTYRPNDVGTSSSKATVEAASEQEEEKRMITMLGEMADMMRDFPNFIVGPERIWEVALVQTAYIQGSTDDRRRGDSASLEPISLPRLLYVAYLLPKSRTSFNASPSI